MLPQKLSNLNQDLTIRRVNKGTEAPVIVAQIFNLPYRRIAFGKTSAHS